MSGGACAASMLASFTVPTLYNHARSRILRETWIERVARPQVKATRVSPMQERESRNHTHRVAMTQSHGQRQERRPLQVELVPSQSSRL